MAGWEEPEEEWDVIERLEPEKEETREGGLEKKLVNRNGFGGLRVVTEAEVLAAEVASDKRLLAMILVLSSRPRQAKELVGVRFYEEGRWKQRTMPQSTAYRILKRLKELGLVEAYKGLDYRKRYYKLTELGRNVAEKLKELLIEKLKTVARIENGKYLVTESKIEETIRLEASLVAEALGLRKGETYGKTYYVVPKRV